MVTFVLALFALPGCQSTLDVANPASLAIPEIPPAISFPGSESQQNSNVVRIESSHSRSSSAEVAQVAGQAEDPEIRALTLSEALIMAIGNSEFIVDQGNFLSSSNPLLDNPQFLQSKFDIDLQNSSQQSVDAALASFDAQLATGFQWGRNSVVQANSNLLNSNLLINDNGSFYGRLDKPLTTGATVSVIHNLNYAADTQAFPQDPRFNGFLRSEFRQPILAGRGRLFTEIAGPNSYRSRQQNNGVALAEISERTAEIDYTLGIERLLKQTEELYWDFWLSQRAHENQQTAAANAHQIWMRIQNRAETGLTGGGAADEAQAEENYFRRKALADSARIAMEQAAARLKHVMGMNDEAAQMLIAVDSPADLPIVFELESSVSNGLDNRKELFKQDLQIQAIEFQLFAAEQLKRPQLDLVSGVQLNGLGDNLFDSTGAFADLAELDDVGWNVGFEFSMPLGFNRQRLNVRYLRILLDKAAAARQLQEKEIRLEIAHTAKTVEDWSQSLTSAQQRLSASQRRLAAMEAEFNSGRADLDLFLRSQDSVAQAEIELARAQAELTKAQIDLLFRQGLTKLPRQEDR